MTQTYHAEINDGQWGNTTFEADSIESALSQTIEWATAGDWSKTDCKAQIHIWSEDGEELKGKVKIPSDTEEDSEIIVGSKDEAPETYHAEINIDEGGETTFEADSMESAISQAIKWVKEGKINVHVWSEDVELGDIVEIPFSTLEEDDDEVIAKYEGEHSTQQITLIENEAYYMHSYQKHPVELTRRVTRSEARALMLDWGYTPDKITKVTRRID